MNSLRRGIVIAGGLGPEAGRYFHGLVIHLTESGGTDQGHIPVIHISNSPAIPDRTDFLYGLADVNPAEAVFEVLKASAAAASSLGLSPVAGVPCNTFHASPIWDRLQELLEKNHVNIELLHMPQETVKYVQKNFPHVKKIGLLCTTSSRKFEIFPRALTPLGYEVLLLPEDVQAKMHESIFDPEWGIKAVSNPVTPRARENFVDFAGQLVDMGSDAIILGCTEIPLTLRESDMRGVPLVDPMVALAEAMIRRVDPVVST